jgi:hypothetical protein
MDKQSALWTRGLPPQRHWALVFWRKTKHTASPLLSPDINYIYQWVEHITGGNSDGSKLLFSKKHWQDCSFHIKIRTCASRRFLGGGGGKGEAKI